jgi:hypothetical protein
VLTTSSSTGWLYLVLTWDEAADEVKAYLNGEQVGSTLTGLSAWAGALAQALVGSGVGGALVWDGCLAHAALWDVALTPDEIAEIAEV